MRTSLLAGLFVLAAPITALAAISAGFPASALWLSESSIAAGDSVTISTALYNSSTTTVRGTVDFLVDDNTVASKNFSLEPGKSTIESGAWMATGGSHTVAAQISDASSDLSGTTELADTETSHLELDVAAPPAGPQQQLSLNSLPAPVQSFLASSSPSVAAAANRAIQLSEAVRQDAANYLQKQLDAASSSAPKGEVLGISTYRAPASTNTTNAGQSWWQQAYYIFLSILLAITKSVALFYPIVALIILFILYLAARTLRRPSRY